MKKLNYLPVALILTVFMACKKDNSPVITTPRAVNLADTLTIKMNETVSSGDFSIKLDSIIMDYRCPINANCFIQGTAIPRLIVQENGNSEIIRLATVPKINSLAPYDTATIFNHLIRLIEVSPYPNGNKIQQNDYIIKLLVQ